MRPPTCDELINEDGFKSVHRETDDSWRHGCYVTEVFHRTADDTFWQADYCLSSDGETNELREGIAGITQVQPEDRVVTVYKPLPAPADSA